MDNKNKIETRDLTDRDFYQQACSYFYYHAEQRTTMIHYYIAVFAAGLALYGTLLEKYPVASALVSIFMLVVSIVFHMIDLRNRFDVKQSQSVITQFEHDYSIDSLREEDDKYLYGVFSNEDYSFQFYGFKKRWDNEEYKELRKLYKKQAKKKATQEIKDLYTAKVDAYYEKINKEINKDTGNNVRRVSKTTLYDSLKNRPIITLSFSIKTLYYLCMGISVVTFVFAVILCF